MKFTRVINGITKTIDSDEMAAEIERMTERERLLWLAEAGCFDCIALFPVNESNRKFESLEEPGRVETIESAEMRGFFHPLDEEGLPIFSVLLDDKGIIVSAEDGADKK